MGTGVSFWGAKMFSNLVMVVKLCDYTKKYCIVYFKRPKPIVWELYLQKAVLGFGGFF